MKTKILKIIVVFAAVVAVGIVTLIMYLKVFLPDVDDAPEIKISSNPEMIKRGEYLANHVMVCIDCHSPRDWNKFSGPLKKGFEGAGGDVFDKNMGFPGVFTAKNITPANLDSWTDGEIFRAITTGVDKNGKAFFPVMPYKNYGKLDREDIEAVVAYLRTLPPVNNEIPASKADFPFSLILNTIPSDAHLEKRPLQSDVIKYGEYLTRAAACADCHTNQVKGKRVGGEFAGGFEFNLGNGTVVRSPNITPHSTGIGTWTKEAFIKRFKMYTDSSYVLPEVNLAKGEFQTVMPWTMYAGMKEEDLGAIYEYLISLSPVENKVEKFTAALK